MEYGVILWDEVRWFSPGPLVWHYTDIVGIFLKYLRKVWNTQYDLSTGTKIISLALPWLAQNIEINVSSFWRGRWIDWAPLRFLACVYIGIQRCVCPAPTTNASFHGRNMRSDISFPFFMSCLFLLSLFLLLFPIFLQSASLIFVLWWSLFIFIFIFTSFPLPPSQNSHFFLVLSNVFLV